MAFQRQRRQHGFVKFLRLRNPTITRRSLEIYCPFGNCTAIALHRHWSATGLCYLINATPMIGT